MKHSGTRVTHELRSWAFVVQVTRLYSFNTAMYALFEPSNRPISRAPPIEIESRVKTPVPGFRHVVSTLLHCLHHQFHIDKILQN